MKGQRRSKGTLYYFFNLGVRWRWMVNATSGRFTRGKYTRYLLYRRWIGPKAGLDGCRKYHPPPPPGFDPWPVQPVARRYIDWAIPAPNINLHCKYFVRHSDLIPKLTHDILYFIQLRIFRRVRKIVKSDYQLRQGSSPYRTTRPTERILTKFDIWAFFENL